MRQAAVSGTEVQTFISHFLFLCLSLSASEFDSTMEDVLAEANAMVGMHRDASSTTSGSVVGGQKFHFIDHDATIMDITDLTLEVIQQYVGMNNWENVLAFVSVCKSWKDATNKYRLKIGVELMEEGDGRKLNVSRFLSYLDQEKFRVAETTYVPCSYCTFDLNWQPSPWNPRILLSLQ